MKELTAALDIFATTLENEGFIKEAELIDIYSNTLDHIEKVAFLPSKKQSPTETRQPLSDEEKQENRKTQKEVERGISHIKEEAKSILDYLDRYKYQLSIQDPLLRNLGDNFNEKVLNLIKDLRKTLIGMKENLRVLEPNKGGLS